MTEHTRRRLETEAARLTKKYGQKAGTLGSEQFQLDVVPTGSLALDFALGTGGWPLGRIIHLYGEPDIGKSSTLGLAAFRSAQACGLTTGLIAVEPGFDPAWAALHGVDPDLLVVARPGNGVDAFNILYDWLTGDIVDFIVFDSIGGVVTPSEDQEEGKAQVGGASGLITSGIRRAVMPTWRNNKGVILLNQVRDDMKSRFGAVKPPGGRLLTHAADVWVHLRQSSGADSFKKIKIDGEDVTVGRNLTAHITRNKMREGTGVKAKFWYYNMATEQFGPVGIDTTADIVATGLRTGVVGRGGAYYRHETFPTDKHQLMGMDAVDTFLTEHPKAVEKIRRDVMTVMLAKSPTIAASEPDLEALNAVVDEAVSAARGTQGFGSSGTA